MPLGQSPLSATGSPTPPVPAPMVPGALPGTTSGAVAPETSKLAIWALVCGCLSLLFSLLASIPAIILGHMGLNQIKKNPALRGHGMALTGLILGYVFTLVLPIISVIAISVLIALGNQVQSVFSTITSQLAEAQATDQAAQDTNSADQSATNSDQTTNAPDQSAPAATNSPDQSTNNAPAAPASTDSRTNSSTPSTNAMDTNTNAAPMGT